MLNYANLDNEEHSAFIREVDDISTPLLAQLYVYWRSKFKGDRLPSRPDIAPQEMKALLPYLWLMDVEEEPQRFRFRLIGTMVTTWAGREFTGEYVDFPIFGSNSEAIARQYAAVVSSRRPTIHRQRAPWPGREFHYYEKLMLPLISPSGARVDMLLCALTMLGVPPAPPR